MSKKIQLKTITAPKIKVADFHGDKVEGVRIVVGGKPKVYVLLRKLCENLGIDFASQTRKVSQWVEEFGESTVVKMTTVAEDGKKREQLAIDLDFLPVFLMSIKTKKVKPELREKLKAYKREAKEVLARYFIDGEEASPTSRELVRESINQATILPNEIAEIKSILEDLKRKEEKAESELTEAKRELIVVVAERLRKEEIKEELDRLKLIIEDESMEEYHEWAKKKYKRLLEYLTDETPTKPMTLQAKEYLILKGYKNAKPGEISMFGKICKKCFERAYGREPSKKLTPIMGGAKEVATYFYDLERDEKVLEEALKEWLDWREKFITRKAKAKKKNKEVSRGKKTA